MNRPFGVAFIAILLLSSCGPDRSPVQAPEINVSGVLINKHVVACPSGEPCDPAGPATYVVFSRSGQPPVRARLGPNGQFSLRLEPGLYAIQIAPPADGLLTPASVEVPPQGKVTLTLLLT